MADSQLSGILTTRQYNLIAALLNETSVRKACEVASVSERTCYKWLKDRPFVDEYRAARREAVSQATARVQQASGAAVSVLFKLATNARSEAVRLGAASKILDVAFKSVEMDDLLSRIAALEDAYAQKL